MNYSYGGLLLLLSFYVAQLIAFEELIDVGLKIDAAASKHSNQYVRIINTMGRDVVVTANCASKNDRIGTKVLRDGHDFAWTFKPHVFGRTLFWCDVTTNNGKSKHWDVYNGKDRSRNWYLRGDGIYDGDARGNGLLKKHGW